MKTFLVLTILKANMNSGIFLTLYFDVKALNVVPKFLN